MTGPDAAAHFDIRDELPSGTTLLEASAGTGKTWTIAALVTRFVAEGRARLGEMLVVTFGRAASQELRERVRGQLVDAERALDAALSGAAGAAGAAAGDTLLELLLDAPRDQLEERRSRLREALVDFDAATIATTHQFCQLVLRSLGVAGDTESGARLVEDLDDLLVEVVDDLYVRGFARVDEQPEFDRRTALAIARAVVEDPQARVEPREAAPGTAAARRVRFAGAVADELEVRKRRLGLLSYDDLLSRLADALADPAAPARARMRARWSVVLVDEFQDTDPVQWRVLDRAFTGHATMVLIGDPKQAIYAFRGGDVVTYLEAAAGATARATLDTNHRSDRELLDSVQAVLRGAALGDERIVVRDVAAAHADRRLRGAPAPAPFRLRVVDPGASGLGARAGIGALRDLVAADLAEDVAVLLASGATFEGRPLRPHQVAVLCEKRTQCELVRAALVERGLQAVVSGGGSVFDTEGAGHWVTLLEALEQPHRSGRVRAAALTAFVGCTVTDLDEGGDAVTQRVAETLRDWADLARRRGTAAVWETACADGLPARVLAQVGGERLLTDLRHVAESLHDAATRDRMSLVALGAWARERRAQARADSSDERTRRLDSDAAAVQVLTVHGSKGLEFPVVHLPFAADLFPREPDFPLFHDPDGERCRDVGGPGSPAAGRSVAREEEAGERLRLLYVAMTRAQSQLVAWWLPSPRNTQQSPLHRVLFGRGPGESQVAAAPTVPPPDRALARLRDWEAAGGPAVELVGPHDGVTTPDRPGTAALDVRRWTRRIDRDWRRTSYTALSSAAAAAEQVLTLGSEPEELPKTDEPELPVPAGPTEEVAAAAAVPSPMAGMPAGATFGSLVHAVLETVDPAAQAHGGDLAAELLARVAAALLRWPVALDQDELVQALVAVLASPLGPLAGERTLGSVSTADRLSELDFELPLAGGDAGRPASTAPGADRPRLSALAPLLRRHLPPGDPLLPYADVLDGAGHEAQVLSGYLTGSIDAVLRLPGDEPAAQRFLVVDYKTNRLGTPEEPLTAADYRPDVLAAAMAHSSYPLQALLYAVVLHRFLRWRLPGYDPAQHLGGVLYLYVRGMCGPDTPRIGGAPCGVFAWRPPAGLVLAVSDLLDGRSAAAGTAPGGR